MVAVLTSQMLSPVYARKEIRCPPRHGTFKHCVQLGSITNVLNGPSNSAPEQRYCFMLTCVHVCERCHIIQASYPNFPGFTEPFLQWYFEQHDTNGDGELYYDEFRAAQSQQFLTGNYSMWKRPASHNTKGTWGYHDDNAKHLWNKLNVIDRYSTSAAIITRDEWVHGMLSQPRTLFCDLFDSTALTHGGNEHDGSKWCSRKLDGTIPEHWGPFNDDGEHGFVVSVSDLPCADNDGCPAGPSTTVCEYRKHRTSNAPATVDCKGAVGKYVQISLPGDGKRIMPTVFVTAHRASIPPLQDADPATAAASTNPRLQTVCYGLKPQPPPAADAVDLLAAAKIHPKTIVDSNPSDPIFWSTCYERVIAKEWLSLAGDASGAEAGDLSRAGVPYSFNNGTQCLACESVRQNYAAVENEMYFTKYADGNCVGSADDILRDFVGTEEECRDKCVEISCTGFIRLHASSTCYFRAGTLTQSDEAGRDCFVLNAADVYMPTPRWWLQEAGTCNDCNREVFNIGNETAAPTAAPIAMQHLLQTQNNVVSMQNPYLFNGEAYDAARPIGMSIGAYTFTGITTAHPFGILAANRSAINVTSGTFSSTENGFDYYTGTVVAEVFGDFGTASYGCSLHGYMGGENRLQFVAQAPTPTWCDSVCTGDARSWRGYRRRRP